MIPSPSPPSSAGQTGRALHITAWTLQVLLALAFVAAAVAKLTGAAMMIDIFDKIGVGQWFRYVTGAVELVAAVLLLAPGRAAWGAALLVATMSGAVLTHLLLIGGNPAPAIVLLALALVVLWIRRRQLPLSVLGAPGAQA